MTDLLNTVKSHLTIKDVNEDNAVFKLFSKVSVGLCLLASAIVKLRHNIGEIQFIAIIQDLKWIQILLKLIVGYMDL
jgi:hypothetical protein